ncbi:MAG: SH3 domain-containing protein [Chitinivibrionia bacterium]|jgi:hypothetical protein|nr:SH3 domain-containing protein [Chitinivibrionia bacterium]
MRFLKLAAVVALFFATSSFAQKEFFVSPTAESGIYANQTRQMNERAIENVEKGAVLRVIDQKGNSYKVRTSAGNEGWIEKRLTVRNDAKKAFTFDDVEIQGYLDNPTPIYITDVDDGSFSAIELDRSFADALKRKNDKERVNRSIR